MSHRPFVTLGSSAVVNPAVDRYRGRAQQVKRREGLMPKCGRTLMVSQVLRLCEG
jgi:hypothetical protein